MSQGNSNNAAAPASNIPTNPHIPLPTHTLPQFPPRFLVSDPAEPVEMSIYGEQPRNPIWESLTRGSVDSNSSKASGDQTEQSSD